MTFEKPEDFYAVYDAHRTYVRADIRRKHIREFTRNIWGPAGFQKDHRVLEIGCGVGLFLAYLQSMGLEDITGVEMDPKTKDYMPESLAKHVHTTTMESFLETHDGALFDRIVMLDVFEHFTFFEGIDVLKTLSKLLNPDGRIILRTPNCASPWGLQFQFNDLTHKAMYAPGNIGHLALAAGLKSYGCLPYTRGSRLRGMTTRAIEWTLDHLLTDPPPIWTPNFITIIGKS